MNRCGRGEHDICSACRRLNSVFLLRQVLGVGNYDMVSYLTAYLFLLMFIPASLIFAPLGGSGTPAVVFSLLLLLWYIAFWIVGRVTPSGGGRPIRIAMLIFALAVLASFVAGMTRDISPG